MLLMVRKYKESIYFGLALAILFFIVQWMEIRFLLFSINLQIYILLIAILFTGIGIWIAGRIRTPKVETLVIEKPVFVNATSDFEIDRNELSKRKISKRELEVLHLMAKGKSNQEIADELFVSLPTIKTHVANLFEKLDAKRRTQAVETAKRLRLLN
jgi:NarL family two-component system response regulator LiaR